MLAIAVPSDPGFSDRANNTAAVADVRSAIPAGEAYYTDVGTTSAGLQAIDAGVELNAIERADQTAAS